MEYRTTNNFTLALARAPLFHVHPMICHTVIKAPAIAIEKTMKAELTAKMRSKVRSGKTSLPSARRTFTFAPTLTSEWADEHPWAMASPHASQREHCQRARAPTTARPIWASKCSEQEKDASEPGLGACRRRHIDMRKCEPVSHGVIITCNRPVWVEQGAAGYLPRPGTRVDEWLLSGKSNCRF